MRVFACIVVALLFACTVASNIDEKQFGVAVLGGCLSIGAWVWSGVFYLQERLSK